MSDSDSDPNNVFTFPNENTIISARGPTTNVNNITEISFKNNALSSTMQTIRNFKRQRDVAYYNDQRSMYYRRETSPMSVMSACDMRQRNFNRSHYPQGVSSQRSVYNGRTGSVISVASKDSSTSVASDIAMAFKNTNFNKHDLRLIKDAYNKFMKHRIRRRIEKRRNLKLFLKGSGRRSGGESGEQGSDSSLSSDGRSTSNYKENMSSCRSTKTDISSFKRIISESNMYKDCTDNFRHNSFRSMVGGPVTNFNSTQTSVYQPRTMVASSNISCRSMPISRNFNPIHREQIAPAMPQNKRFNSGFLLPSQRFNRSVASSTIPENNQIINQNGDKNLQSVRDVAINRNTEIDSDQDDLFFETSEQRTHINNQRKRSIDSDDDINMPNQKRSKIVSPCKNNIEYRKTIPKDLKGTIFNSVKSNDFVFAKPTLPIRKSAKEKLISKSAPPISDALALVKDTSIQNSIVKGPEEQGKHCEDEQSNVTQDSTNLTMRPSFIKRKLFTQKLDISEKKNTSVDSLNSPQNSIYGGIQKEKHKARKLQQATTQSCLSRDVQDESNLLDLIHKIVPPNQMNVTNVTNKTDFQCSKNKTEENEDNWDVTSIITEQKDNEDMSDTFTDEEIFNASVKELAKENVKKKLSKENVAKEHVVRKIPENLKDCKVLLVKHPANYKKIQNQKSNTVKDVVSSKSIQKCIKTFWDTDFESDAECQPRPRNGQINMTGNHTTEMQAPTEPSKFHGLSTMFNSKKTTAATSDNVVAYLNGTVNNVQKFNSTSLRMRSHRTPKRKKLDQSIDDIAQSALCEPQSKKLKILQEKTRIELSKTDSIMKSELQNKNSKKTTPKQACKQQENKKSPQNTKKTFKADKFNKSTETLKGGTPKKETNSKKKSSRVDKVDKLKSTETPKKVVTPKKQPNRQVKLGRNETPNHSSKKTDKSERITKKEANNTQKKPTPQKKTEPKQDNTLIEKKTKIITNDTNNSQKKHKATNKKQNENKEQTKKHSNKKEKLVQDNGTIEQQNITNDTNKSQSKQNASNKWQNENKEEKKKQPLSNKKDKLVQDDSTIEQQTKNITNDTNISQCKQKASNKKQNGNKKQSKKRPNCNNKKENSIKDDDTKTKKQTNTLRKSAETKKQNKK